MKTEWRNFNLPVICEALAGMFWVSEEARAVGRSEAVAE